MGCGASAQQELLSQHTQAESLRTGASAGGAAAAPGSAPVARRSAPLTAPRAWKEADSVTLWEMAQRREEFWHTRVSGSAQVWSLLQMASNTMLSGEVDTANAILAAGDVSTPNGTLALCYDELGRVYEVPPFAYSNPTNLVDDIERDKLMAQMNKDLHAAQGAPAGGDAAIDVKFRVAPRDDLYSATLRSAARIAECKAVMADALEGAAKVAPERMRLIWWGRELGDDVILHTTGVREGHVLQIFPRPAPRTAPDAQR